MDSPARIRLSSASRAAAGSAGDEQDRRRHNWKQQRFGERGDRTIERTSLDEESRQATRRFDIRV
jgi:hypothetical protein